MSTNTITKNFINFKFLLEEGKEIKFELQLDDNWQIVEWQKLKNFHEDWTDLNYFACPNCPLDKTTVRHCPLAQTILRFVKVFALNLSTENCVVFVETPTRGYYKNATLQQGASALLGVFMVSSGCPIMAKLKPLLRFHLPFSTLEETQLRACGYYLVAQFIKSKQNLNPDFEMKNLFKFYEDIKTLNQNVAQKIADLVQKDASLNSLVILDTFANYITLSLEENEYESLSEILKEFF